MCNLRPSIMYCISCDRIVQRAYYPHLYFLMKIADPAIPHWILSRSRRPFSACNNTNRRRVHAGLTGGNQICLELSGFSGDSVLKTVTYGCNENILQKIAKNRR